jgi:periplasmic protein TonB
MSATKTPKKMILPAIVGLVLLVAMGYVVVGLLSSDKTETGRDAAEAAKAVAEAGSNAAEGTPEDLQRLLQEAKAANEKGQLVAPEGANAVELYLKVLEVDADNRLAKDALNELMPYATDRTDQYISEGNIPQAERALSLLRKADPSSSVILTTLAGKIENLKRIQASRESEQQAAILAQQQQALQRAQEQAGTTPPADSATPDPVTATPEPAAVRTERPTPASSTATTGTRPTPAPTNTPPPATAPAVPTPALENRNFQLARKVEASYPQRALRQRLEGWVELSFTITASGDVTDVKVVDSQPRREFDREAVRALSQWKFKPRLENGKAVSSVARQRLEFKLGG